MRSGVAQVKVATAADTETATARCKLVGVTLVSWSVYILVFIVYCFVLCLLLWALLSVYCVLSCVCFCSCNR